MGRGGTSRTAKGGREVESIRIKVLIAKCDMAILIEKKKKKR